METLIMAKSAIQKIAMNPSENIAYDKLVLSQQNVRRVKDGVTIEQLAEDIGRRKLLQSLNVRPVLDGDGEETGTYEVPAGGRRYLALGILVKQKRLTKNEPIPCIVNRSGTTSAEEDSLAENVHRENLHPLDQFRAFKALREQGLDVEEIAARFFVSAATVKQRLRLASVSPKLLELYEKDEIRLEQIMAFSISDDHARQEQVWERISGNLQMQEPYYIRRLLTETTVRADDRRAVYVGAEAYEAAGGVILRDLFEQDSGGWFQDAALLEQLVFDRLKADAETIRAEGWKWVEAAISFPYGHTSGMRRVYAEPAEMSTEEIARYGAVKAEYDALDAKYAEMEDADQEIEDRLDQLGAELDGFGDRPQVYDPMQKAIAGAFVTLGANGQLQVEAGFVRPEDEPRVE
ncbi:MAG: DNA-binding protein, partial [Mesorhizobium sp.]